MLGFNLINLNTAQTAQLMNLVEVAEHYQDNFNVDYQVYQDIYFSIITQP